MTTAIIIDDEKKARDFIEMIISRNFPDIKISGKASSVVEGIKLINQVSPDLVFLDIEMQDGTGFDLLEALPDKNFDLIFVTAYNYHAVKAFKFSAVDYVVKPIDIEDFKNAVEKVLTKNQLLKKSQSLDILKSNLRSKAPLKIAIPVLEGIEYIETASIVSFNADGRYTRIFLEGGKKIIVSKSLGEFNDLIDNITFFKPHKSHIINLTHVNKYVKKGCYLLMSDGSEVPLSRGNRDSFISIMSD